jgi:DNA-binding CsgD family transcriptional regulator/PAS domain-containing protein
VYSQRTILDLVDHIYGAVENEALLPTFLDQFAHTLQAQIGTLYIHDLRTQKGSAELVTGMDPVHDRAYRAYYAPRNVYMTQGRALLVAGNVMTSEELCPDEKVLPSEFYNEWVRPQGLRRGLNGVLFNEGSLAGSIGAIRARAVRPFSVDDKRFLRALMPHLQRAVKLRRRIAELESLERTAADALDHWTTAVFVVDREGRILLANQKAVVLLRIPDGLSTDRNIVQAVSSNDSAKLHKIIRDAVDAPYHRSSAGAILAARPSGKSPLQILVTPSVREDIFFGTRGTALVFVSDPETQRTQTDVLRTLYGLTPAETIVASLLAEGKSVKEIADRTTVRENTVRMHLKKIFDKTGTKRQAALVTIVLSGPATLHTRR